MIKKIGFHCIFWFIFSLWATFITHWTHNLINSEDTIWDSLLYSLMRIPLIAIGTYVLIYWLLPRYVLKEKKYVQFVILIIITIIAIFILDRFLVSLTTPNEEYQFFNQTATVRNFYLLISAMGLASIIRLFGIYLSQEKHRFTLMEDSLKSQLSFLKAQMNPHFLFNALNGIYSLAVQSEQKEIANGIENLSGIMKYLTYDSSKNLVPLKKEVKLIQDYIDIQYLRLSDKNNLTISFTTDGELDNVSVTPVILLPFVENAFKHGVKPELSCMVQLKLEVHHSRLCFQVTNSNFSNAPTSSTGIGMTNVKKRLDIVYKNKYSLVVDQSDEIYRSTLIIQLN